MVEIILLTEGQKGRGQKGRRAEGQIGHEERYKDTRTKCLKTSDKLNFPFSTTDGKTRSLETSISLYWSNKCFFLLVLD